MKSSVLKFQQLVSDGADSDPGSRNPWPPCCVPVQGGQTLSELAHENPAGTRKIIWYVILCVVCMTLHQIHK